MLFRKAVAAFGEPKYLITDLGGEFKGAFKRALRREGVVRRFRRKDYIAETARLEASWRTLKNIASLRLPIFLTL